MAARRRPSSPATPLGSLVVADVAVLSPGSRSWWPVCRWVSGVLVLGGVAGDQHSGHGPVTGQPPTGLGVQRPGPADLTPHRIGVAEQAVQVHDHAQLRADPTGLGQPTGLQGAAGQLGQGVGVALGAAAGVVGVGRAGQRFQGGQEGLAGLRFQQPIHRHHAFEGWGQPQPPAGMTPLSVTVGAVGVSDLEQMAQEPPQPTWVEPPGRLDQHRFGLGGDLVGQRMGAGGDHLGMGD